jgi:hypothetical protein
MASLRFFCYLIAGSFLAASALRADPVLPGNLLDPRTPAQAWNVIRLATSNVDRLIQEERMEEIPKQISYCSPALRLLPTLLQDPAKATAAHALTQQSFLSVNAIALAAQQKNPPGVKTAFTSLQGIIGKLAEHFDPATVKADVYCCPMHPDHVSDDKTAVCPKCTMPLLSRRLPYSFIYTKPGEPTISLTAEAPGPVEAGKPLQGRVRLKFKDGNPVLLRDLMVMHTQPIHLLIEEPGLSDYHHVHPMPTDIPGEYTFSFTPAKSASYRIWADLVPVQSGIQELPFTDLPAPADTVATPPDTSPRFTSTVDGYQFSIGFREGLQTPFKAGHTRQMTITVRAANGQPVTTLEPVLQAFSHLVGFYDDFKSVVHLHPTGGDILDPALRGGPTLGFMMYAPRPGFLRLYCQVSIGGKMLFAPFGINVVP